MQWKKCSEYVYISDPSLPFIVCTNIHCHNVFCSLCGRDDHWGKTCPNVLEAKREEFENTVNTAMNKAIMRCCPHCDYAQMKISGCNRINCANCHRNFCYVCRAALPDVDPYVHFRAVPAHAVPFAAQQQQDQENAHTEGVKAAKKWKRDNPNPEFRSFTLPPGFGIRPEEIQV